MYVTLFVFYNLILFEFFLINMRRIYLCFLYLVKYLVLHLCHVISYCIKLFLPSFSWYCLSKPYIIKMHHYLKKSMHFTYLKIYLKISIGFLLSIELIYALKDWNQDLQKIIKFSSFFKNTLPFNLLELFWGFKSSLM